jgi:Protein of unknown function (DUF3187)
MPRLVLWLCCSLLVLSATRVRAEEFYGFGPAPVRNYQPIQLIFLNLPVERARTVAPGDVDVHLETVESNTIVTEDEPRIQAILKFETNRTVIGSKVGLRPGLEVGIDIPFISRFGGFMDPFIDSIESFFGASNPERSLYPNNSFGAFFVRQGDITLFGGKHEDPEIGDMWLSAKQEILHAPGLPLVSLRGAVKLPTGDVAEVFGSGHPDFGLGFAADYQPFRRLWLYGNLSGIYPVGPITPVNLTLNPILNQALAAELELWRDCSLLLQQEVYTSPIHGTGTRMLDGTVVEITAGANARWGPALFQLAFVDNISPVATAADFSAMLRVTYRH